MEGAFKMSGLRRWCLIASISLRHVCHRHGSEPIPENQCPLEPLRRLDRVAGKPSKCYSVLTAQNPQCKVRNTSLKYSLHQEQRQPCRLSRVGQVRGIAVCLASRVATELQH